jgi:predicted MPP superfamily phosphohydrolase
MKLDFSALRACLASEPRVVHLPEEGKAVFVGDTHGDVMATREVLQRYFKPGYSLVFLGDYVDRGRASRENISLLLTKKLEAPDRITLLMGNHEGYAFQELWPADFWSSLSKEESRQFGEVLGLLPYMAVSGNGLLAVHGVPPALSTTENLRGVERIVPGSNAWHTLVWGDFTVNRSSCAHDDAFGRPTYDASYFDRVMDRYGKKVLIRAHQPNFPQVAFGQRCVTIMSTRALRVPRRIAIADLGQPAIDSVSDMTIAALN